MPVMLPVEPAVEYVKFSIVLPVTVYRPVGVEAVIALSVPDAPVIVKFEMVLFVIFNAPPGLPPMINGIVPVLG